MSCITTQLQSTTIRGRDFGTFYPAHVEDMVTQSDDVYNPPDFPVALPDLTDAAETDFGEEMEKKYFMHEPGWAFLNHGSFGSALRPAVEFSQALQLYSERQTNRWYDRMMLPLLARVTRKMAKFVHCHPTDLVLTENATVGNCSVIESLRLGRGDSVCYFNFLYGSVKKQLRHWLEKKGVKLNEIIVDVPITSEKEILSQFELALDLPGTKFAVVDHIPSNLPFILPVRKIARMCRDRNVRLLVDGAHALGSVDLHLEEWGVDYYVANAHKWMCAPKGCAILYCRKELQSTLHSVIVSHGHGFGIAGEFHWAGTKEYHSLMSLEVVLNFWETVGDDKIRNHIIDGSKKAREYLSKLWKSEYVIPDEMIAPLVNIRLPLDLYSHCSVVDYNRAEYLGEVLHTRYKIEIPVKVVDGHLYVRVSYHIYNTWRDIVKLGDAILELTNENVLGKFQDHKASCTSGGVGCPLALTRNPSKGRRGFGSFYASNVQEMLNLPEDAYDPPEWPVPKPDLKKAASSEFGLEMKKFFFQESEWSLLNHGAFGAGLKPAVQFSQALQNYSEQQPARWFDRTVLPLLARVNRRMAKFVHCHPSDLALVQNVTIGNASVIESLQLGPGDAVCYFNFIYWAMTKQLSYWCEARGVKLNKINLTLPVTSEQQILSKFEEALDLPGTKFAIVDHIPSSLPFVLPVPKMVNMCRARNIRLLVDGAHALGSVDLHLEEWGVDYYVANAHKWMCAPKGCAILYCRKELQSSLHSVIVSHGHGSGMASEFLWAGTKDYHSLMSLEVVMDFWESVGVDKIRNHITEQARKARKYLSDMWKTEYVIPDEMMAPLVCVRLPHTLYSECSTVDSARAEYLSDLLYKTHKIEVPVKVVDGHLHVRVSYHIYNTWRDIVKLGEAILEFTNENVLSKCEKMTLY